MDLTTLVAIGVPALVAALAYALRSWADARAKNAEAAKIKAETERAKAEHTGRILTGAEADAETVRGALADMRGRLDRCEKRHEDCETRVIAVETRCNAEHAAKDAQIGALWKECGDLRASIEGAR